VTSADDSERRKPRADEIVAVIRRVLAENAREYLPLYGMALFRSSLYPMWLAVVSLPAGLGAASRSPPRGSRRSR
jgi:hypothetical protein